MKKFNKKALGWNLASTPVVSAIVVKVVVGTSGLPAFVVVMGVMMSLTLMYVGIYLVQNSE